MNSAISPMPALLLNGLLEKVWNTIAYKTVGKTACKLLILLFILLLLQPDDPDDQLYQESFNFFFFSSRLAHFCSFRRKADLDKRRRFQFHFYLLQLPLVGTYFH